MRPVFLWAGLLTGAAYVLIWMFNGKRSHSLIGLLATICAFYLTRLKRPSWPVLITTGVIGALVVTIAIGWREAATIRASVAGFVQYLTDFQPEKILVNLNVKDDDDGPEIMSYESFEYGGFLLMMDTVPAKSPYDYGESYLRIFSTFIPRIIWPNKPLFGRSKWISAWIAGSEMERADDFAGPAIGILGATQLNGGALGTFIVLGCDRVRDALRVRIPSPLPRCSLGAVLVGDHLLQRLVHGRHRRPARLVLLQLGVHGDAGRRSVMVVEPRAVADGSRQSSRFESHA